MGVVAGAVETRSHLVAFLPGERPAHKVSALPVAPKRRGQEVGSWPWRGSKSGIELIRRKVCCMWGRFFFRNECKPCSPEGSDDNSTCNPMASTFPIDRYVRYIG